MEMKGKVIGEMAIFIIAILALSVFSGCAEEKETTVQTTTPPPGFITYENSTHGIKIMYPQEWEKLENYMGTTVLFRSPLENSSDTFQENVNIAYETVTSSMTLKDYTDLSIDQIKNTFEGIELIESNSANLAGVPAKRVVFKGKQYGYDLKWLQFYLLKGNKAYMITYTAEENKFDKYMSTVQTMVNTFEIL